MLTHGKKQFAKVSKNLKIILLDHKNNYIKNSNIISNVAKYFDSLVISLSLLHNYFDSLIKLSDKFSDLYSAKFLNTSAKLFLCDSLPYAILDDF